MKLLTLTTVFLLVLLSTSSVLAGGGGGGWIDFEDIDYGEVNDKPKPRENNGIDFREIEEIDFESGSPAPVNNNNNQGNNNGVATEPEIEEIPFELDNEEGDNQQQNCLCGNITKVNGRFKFEVNIEAYHDPNDGDIIAKFAEDEDVADEPQGYKICGGHIISDRHVLTAASCVKNRQLIVRRGKSEADEMLFVKKQLSPQGAKNNLMVLELEEPLVFDENIGPMCLPNWNAKKGIDSDTFGYINFHQETQDHAKWTQLLGYEVKPEAHYTVSKNPNCSIEGSVLAVVNEGIVYHLGVAHPEATKKCLSGEMNSSIFDRNFAYMDFFRNLLKGSQYCPSKNHITLDNKNPAETDAASHSPEDVENENNGPLDCECGMENVMSRIRNGKEAQSGRYPWMVSIISAPNRSCGGSLISDRHILTAARCVSSPKEEIKVSLGVTTEAERIIKAGLAIDEIFTHKGYSDSARTNNLAIIKLKTPVDTSAKGFSHICLSNRKEIEQELFLTGWGVTKDGSSDGLLGSKTLMEAVLPLQSPRMCSVLYGRFFTSTKMCAGMCTGGTLGDGGSPLSERRDGRVFQVGVSDFGHNGCNSGRKVPDVYESVFQNLQWIKDNTKEGRMCKNPDFV